MNTKIYEILEDIKKPNPNEDAHTAQVTKLKQVSGLLVLLAEEAEKNATRTERATKWIVRLTWAIAILTFFLFLTSFLVFPKARIVFDKNRTLKIETYTEPNDNQNVQTFTNGSKDKPSLSK